MFQQIMGCEKNRSKYNIVQYSPLERLVVSHGYDNTGGRELGWAWWTLGMFAREGGGAGGRVPHPPLPAASFCSTIVLLTFISAPRKFNKSIESRILFISQLSGLLCDTAISLRDALFNITFKSTFIKVNP